MQRASPLPSELKYFTEKLLNSEFDFWIRRTPSPPTPKWRSHNFRIISGFG